MSNVTGHDFFIRQAAYFEPVDQHEATLIQQYFLSLGYNWGPGNKTVRFVQRCVDQGITALPGGRLFCGMPDGETAVTLRYEDLPAPKKPTPMQPSAAMSEIERFRLLTDVQLREVREQMTRQGRDLTTSYNALSRRLDDIEKAQRAMDGKLDEILDLLRPAKLTLPPRV